MNYKHDITLTDGQEIYFNNVYSLNSIIDVSFIHMSNIRRYCGAVDWTLLNHSLLCWSMANILCNNLDFDKKQNIVRLSKLCYVHDIHECIVGDMVTGLKKYCPEYIALENAWEQRCSELLNLGKITPEEKTFVKWIDYNALCIEMYINGHPAIKHFDPLMIQNAINLYEHAAIEIRNMPLEKKKTKHYLILG